MICPKCKSDSKLISIIQYLSVQKSTIVNHYQCNNDECLHLFDDGYQQRLDKVLEKFDSYGDVHYQLILEYTQSGLNDETISINYNKLNDIFYFTTDEIINIGNNNELERNIEYKISLETVESLLKDLEVAK